MAVYPDVASLAASVLEEVALAGRLEDVATKSQAVEHSTGQAFAAGHLSPLATNGKFVVTITLCRSHDLVLRADVGANVKDTRAWL